MLQHVGRVATRRLVPRNCLRYLQTTLKMGVQGLISKFMWSIVWKNKWKRKRGLKDLASFCLKPLFLMFGGSQMVLCLIASILDVFDPQKIFTCLMGYKINGLYNGFLLLWVNIVIIQSVLFLYMLYIKNTNKFL